MVDEHPHPPARSRSEVDHGLGQSIEAVEPLDHHALGPQIVAPDLFDELGVVHAFDEDSAGLRDARSVVDGHRSGGRARGTALRALWRYEGDDAAVDDEAAGEEPHGPFSAAAVAQHDDARLGPHHEADETGRGVVHDASGRGLDDRIDLAPSARSVEIGEAAQNPAIRLGHAHENVPRAFCANADPGYKLAATG